MSLLIVFRHGDRLKNTGELSGDGPLTPKGIEDVTVSAHNLALFLQRHGYTQICLAVVSGSIRCAQTFGIIWHVLLKFGIRISEYDMNKEYFSTSHEDEGWNKLYANHREELLTEIKEVGEKAAVLKWAGNLVRPCVRRTTRRINQAYAAGQSNVLVITHSPHDCLIEEHYSQVELSQCLEQGNFRTLIF
jgi:broad specificity phosphatase PhoE